MVKYSLLSAVLCLVGTTAHASLLRRDGCIYSAEAEESDDTLSMAEAWAISESDFVRHNPGVSLGATLEAGREYCIEWEAGAVALPDSSVAAAAAAAAPSSTKDGGGDDVITASLNAPATVSTRPQRPSPTQGGLTTDCTSYHLVESGETCMKIMSKYSNVFTLEQFYSWNPAVGNDCISLWLGYYVCIGVNGSPIPSSTTRPFNGETPCCLSFHVLCSAPAPGINTPEPTQPGMVDNCDGFYYVQPGEGCASIASKHGISLDQFLAWNPTVGEDCHALWANANACVSIIGHEPSATKPDNGIKTPLPTQPDMVGNCKTFHFVTPGESCWGIADRYGISLDDFYKWNPKTGDGCASLWANANACIAVL
ncbi:hypothetical protein CP532_2869 [Ophiocordyceps camponoti-leonardi (nom. inval.)]|nr:hypothetical protein CP532_2869 [Ophiocordyceps camponoti-leonardi (nom. inval.)]